MFIKTLSFCQNLGTFIILKTTACKLVEKNKKIDYGGCLHKISLISRKKKWK